MSKKEENVKTRTTRSVYFSLLEPEDVELLAHAEKKNPITGDKRNFSKYVRRLIEEDMRKERRGGNSAPGGYNVIDVDNDEDEGYAIEVKNAMNSFL